MGRVAPLASRRSSTSDAGLNEDEVLLPFLHFILAAYSLPLFILLGNLAKSMITRTLTLRLRP